MKRTAVFALALLFAPCISSAQSTPKFQLPRNFNPKPQTTFSVNVFPGTGACPAVMHARHEPGLHAQRYVAHDSKPETPAMKLVLTLTGGHAEITHASVIVQGLNGNSHMVQTNTIRAGHPQTTRALDLSFVPDGDHSVTTDLVLPGFTSVSSIDVVSVTYADGSTWRPLQGRACLVTPDPFMPVVQ